MKNIFIATTFLIVSFLPALAQTSESIQFKTNVFILEGTLTLPATTDSSVPVVLLLAGSGPTDRNGNSSFMKSNVYQILADSLVSQGIAVARYDKRGAGKSKLIDVSKLRPEDKLFDALISDAVAFIRQLKADKRFSRVVVAGHSEGSLVGMVAARQTQADGFISIAGIGRNIADVIKTQFGYALPDSLRPASYRIVDSLRVGRIVTKVPAMLLSIFAPASQPGLISWMKYEPTQEIKGYRGPVLIIQGTNDFQVAVSEAELLKQARPDAELVLVPNMTHMLRTYEGKNQAENIKTYTNPDLPLTPGLIMPIVKFVKL